MGDFFTFFVIAIFIYNLFAKKDKPPQRGQRNAEKPQRPPSPQAESKKENIFDSLERQIRESAERLEKELQGGKTQPKKPTTVNTYRRKTEARPTGDQTKGKVAKQTESVWGQEGRSDYDQYVSTQGTEGVEGIGGVEGTWGTEGRDYANRQKDKNVEQAGSGKEPFVQQERYAGTLAFSPSEVVQGIIWAEVLSEPRGRKGLPR